MRRSTPPSTLRRRSQNGAGPRATQCTTAADNPEGCWDFWGYTDAGEALAGAQGQFARRSAPQLRAVKAMVDALLRPVGP